KMNNARYEPPQKYKRDLVSLEVFCKDCQKDKKTCGKNVVQCIKEANIYREFVKIKKSNI
ncbi:MAG: hypothetical protein ACOC4G_12855, partial [Bacillota bacterium]